MATLARWCYRHRLVVLLLWVGALFGVGFAGSAAGTDYANTFSLPNTDSTRAYDLMEKAFPQSSGDTDTVVWKVDDGTVRDESVRSRIEPALEEIGRMEGVGEVSSPYAAQGAAQISENGRIAYAQVTFTEQANGVPKELVEDVVDTAQDAERAGLQVELGGQAITRVQEPPTGIAELVGIVAAAVVLFIAFGSLYAMLLPLVVAIAALGTGLMATSLLSHVTDVPEVAPLLGSLIGLGVGIDYALFIVTRHRKGILRGMKPEEAAVTALNTSGRAVLFAGGTVCIALAGMLVMNLRFLDGVVIATSLTVVLSVLAATTLLPALLGLLGMRVLSRRQRRRSPPRDRSPRRRAGLRHAGPGSSRGARARSPSWHWPRWWSWRCPSCRSGSVPPTRATTRSRRPHDRRTTCSPRASGPASTARSRWSRNAATRTRSSRPSARRRVSRRSLPRRPPRASR